MYVYYFESYIEPGTFFHIHGPIDAFIGDDVTAKWMVPGTTDEDGVWEKPR